MGVPAWHSLLSRQLTLQHEAGVRQVTLAVASGTDLLHIGYPAHRALANLEPLRLRLQESLLRSGGVAPRVVAYCNTGQRSGPASIWLSERLGMPVGGWSPAAAAA
jgi:hypothetical protein